MGATTPELVASLGTATLLGVPLVERGYLGAGRAHLAVVAGLAVTAATLAQSAVVCRWFPTPGSPAARRRLAG